MIEDTKIKMIGSDGRVRIVPDYMKDKLIAQGFRLIVNAKEEYYPQHDIRNGGDKALNIMEDVEPIDQLEVEKL